MVPQRSDCPCGWGPRSVAAPTDQESESQSVSCRRNLFAAVWPETKDAPLQRRLQWFADAHDALDAAVAAAYGWSVEMSEDDVLREAYLHELGNAPGNFQHWSRRSIVRFVAEGLPGFNIVDRCAPLPWTMAVRRHRTAG